MYAILFEIETGGAPYFIGGQQRGVIRQIGQPCAPNVHLMREQSKWRWRSLPTGIVPHAMDVRTGALYPIAVRIPGGKAMVWFAERLMRNQGLPADGIAGIEADARLRS